MFGRKVVNAVAQALLVFIISWILCFTILPLLKVAFGYDGSQTLLEILSELPLFNAWVMLLNTYTIGKSNPEAMLLLTPLVWAGAFVDSLFVGLIVHVINSVKEFCEGAIGRRTFNILSTYLGVVISVAVLLVVQQVADLTAVLLELGAIVLMLFGFKLMLSGVLQKKLLGFGELLGIVVDSIYGVMVCGYAVKIVMISSGGVRVLAVGIAEILAYTVVLIIGGFLAWLLTGKKNI